MGFFLEISSSLHPRNRLFTPNPIALPSRLPISGAGREFKPKKALNFYRLPSIFQRISLPEGGKSWGFSSFSARACVGTLETGKATNICQINLINTISC
jgi:hypothetical protein